MKVYKLTDEKGQTYNNTQWGEGITHEIGVNSNELCSEQVIHCYRDPLIAVLANPIHARFEEYILWECEAGNIVSEDALKAGCKILTSLRRIKAPTVNKAQRIRWGILCALEVYNDDAFAAWASAWLDKSDRTAGAAERAAWVAAGAAARAAGAAARAAGAAAGAAEGTAGVAWAAEGAAGVAGAAIDILALANKAMEEE